MGNTLTGQTVLLFGGQKDIAPQPIITLGIDANGLPQPILVGTTGASSVNLAQVGGATFALGQALAAASLPVVLTAAQITSLTGFLTNAQLRASAVPVIASGYTGAGATSAASNNDSVKIGSTVVTARKIDIINTGSAGIWVNRGAAAAVGSSYYLAQYGVLSVDEPTLDDFFFISPSGSQTVAYVPRTAA